MLWSAPRTLSTCVERVLLESSAIHVHHEPFGVPFYWSKEAPSSRQADDPRRETSFATVAHKVWHAPAPSGVDAVFSKDHAYYFAPHCLHRLAEFTAGVDVRHSFIIRHPRRAIVSLYNKSCVDNGGTGYKYFDRAEAGFVAMWSLLCHIEEAAPPGEAPPPIIDADDLLEDPEGVLRAYCAALGLPFDSSMLHWGDKPVPRQLRESAWSGWTEAVCSSPGVVPRMRVPLPSLDGLPEEVLDAIAEAMPIYEQMHARRIQPSTHAREVAHAPLTTAVKRAIEVGKDGSGSESSEVKEGSDISEEEAAAP